MTTYSWQGGNGDWGDVSNWSGGVPDSPTDSAVLGGTGSYTATIAGNETFTIDNLLLNDSGANLLIQGTLEVDGAFTIKTGALALSGSLIGGALVFGGPNVQLTSNGGNLEDVQVRGTLKMSTVQGSDQLNIWGGVTFTGTGGTGPGSINIAGVGSFLAFHGSQTLTNAAVTLGGTPQLAQIFIDNVGQGPIATLTLGSSLNIVTGGNDVSISGNGEVVNGGTITADTAPLPLGGTNYQVSQFVINPYIFINGKGGTISISQGEQMLIAANRFTNLGTITVTGYSAAADVASTLHLQGRIAETALGNIQVSDHGYLAIDGLCTLVNAGDVFKVGTGSSLDTVILTGTIQGGTIQDTGRGFFFNGGRLDNVTYEGTLLLEGPPVPPNNNLAAGVVNIYDGITLTGANGTGVGTIDETYAGGDTLNFVGTQSLNAGTIDIGSAGGDLLQAVDDGAAATLTLGSGVTIDVAGNGTMTSLGGPQSDESIVSHGAIVADATGGVFTINPGTFINYGAITITGTGTGAGSQSVVIDAGHFTNDGTITVTGTGAVLHLGGVVQSTQLGTISAVNGGAAELDGTLINSSIHVGKGSPVGAVVLAFTGVVQGGIIHDGGTGFVYANGVFDNVQYEGTIDMSAGGATLRILDHLAFTDATGKKPGTIELTGANSLLSILGTQTLGGGTIAIGNAENLGQATLRATDNGTAATLTLAAGLTIVHAGGNAFLSGDGDATIVSNAAITAGKGQSILTINPGMFINDGTISVLGGDTVVISAGNFLNNGKITVANQSALQLVGNYATGSLGTIDNQAGGTVAILNGALDNSGATLTVGSGTALGTLTLGNGGAIQYGTIDDKGGGFIFSGGNLDAVTYEGPLTIGSGLVNIFDGITMESATGTLGGVINVSGANSTLAFAGTQLVKNLTINLGSGTNFDEMQVNNVGPALATLTLDKSDSLLFNGAVGETVTVAGNGVLTNAGQFQLNTQTGTFNINTFAFINSGSIAVSNGVTLTIAVGNIFTNTGTLTTSTGTNEIRLLSAVNGTGGKIIIDQGTVEIGSTISSGQQITLNGNADTLVIDHANGFQAGVKGFKAGDTIDLADVSFGNASLGFNSKTDVLTVSDGTNTARIQLFGQYVAADFQTNNDGRGFTAITYTGPTPSHGLVQLAAGH